MSGRIVEEMLDCAPADLTKHEMLVLVALATSAFDRDRTARAHASADALADRTRSTPGAVRNTLVLLKKRGLIVPLIDRPARGHGQQWYIPKLQPEHRSAMVRAQLPSDANNRNPEGGKRHRRSDAKSAASRHQEVTPEPVEKPDPVEEIASLPSLEERHLRVAPPVKPNPVEPVLGTQVTGKVSDDDPFAPTGAELARAALNSSRRDR